MTTRPDDTHENRPAQIPLAIPSIGMLVRALGYLTKNRFAYLAISPAMLLILLLVCYPLARGIMLSFYNIYLLLPQRNFVGVDNFVQLAGDTMFKHSLTITLEWALATTLLVFLCGMPLALLLNLPLPGRGLIRGLILIPWAVPPLVAGISWRWLFSDQFGPINALLNTVGLHVGPFPWLANTTTALPAAIVAYVWKATPFIVLVLLAGLQAVPGELYEAADMDGASPFARFLHVTLPSLRDIIVISSLLSVIWAFQQFDIVWIMTQGGPAQATQLLPIEIYLTAFQGLHLSYGAAMSVVMFFILAVLSIAYLVVFNREEKS